MKLTTILLAAVAAVAIWPARADAEELAESVAQRIASLASFASLENFTPSCTNPVPAEDTQCGDGHCGSCAHCCHQMDLWGSAEFLLWWAKGGVTPALVTTSPPGTAQANAGVLPDAEVLFGRSYLGDQIQAGGRVTFGIWLDDEHNVGAAGRFYATNGHSDSFVSSDEEILGRPFFNVLLDQNDALLVNFPGVVSGDLEADYSNQNFLGAETFLSIMMQRNRCRRVDLIAGYQFMRLDDRLLIDSTHNLTGLGIQLDIRDRFAAQNEFHGGQIGLRGQMMRGCWSLDALGKVALGSMRQEVSISGSTQVTPGGNFDGGLLAQPTNIGEHQRDKFAWIPELTLNLRYHHTPNVSFHAGYTLIWFSDVVTSGRHIDTGVNTTQIGGPLVGAARPAFDFHDESYWLQGINFGVNWDF
jgi:hypothetical protein